MSTSNIGRAERGFALGEVKTRSPEARMRAAEEKAARPKLEPLPLSAGQRAERERRKASARLRRMGKKS